MADYPEHDKLRAIKDQSQVIGEFIDHGLPRQSLALYEKIVYPCDCGSCVRRQGHRTGHAAAARATAVDGVVQITEWRPTYKTIDAILAEHFEIDRDRIDDEKRAMLAALRANQPKEQSCPS